MGFWGKIHDGGYHLIFNTYAQMLGYLSASLKIKPTANIPNGAVNTEVLVVTVAFNQEKLIAKQTELVSRHVKDTSYKHVIFDNSTQKRKREAIRRICEERRLEYVEIPAYIRKAICPRWFMSGISHGTALNWLWYHYVIPCAPKMVVFLDHDLFPFRDVCMRNILDERPFYGVDRMRKGKWYLWPGMMMLSFRDLWQMKPNFLPTFVGDVYLDAGGSNYFQIFREYEYDNMRFADTKTARIKKSKLYRNDDIYHGDCVQVIDQLWIHVINGSNYAGIKGKDRVVNEILERFDEFVRYLERIKLITN